MSDPHVAPIGAVYRHFKGGLYRYLGEAVSAGDGTIQVIYLSLSTGVIYCRPREEFFAFVYSGRDTLAMIQRFTAVTLPPKEHTP